MTDPVATAYHPQLGPAWVEPTEKPGYLRLRSKRTGETRFMARDRVAFRKTRAKEISK